MELGNIFLIGPMGAGKTTIGRQLAKTLRYEFYDSDKEIESRTGVDIPLIFEYEGEAGFRKRERSAIRDLTARKPIVLATGGGVILDPENRQMLTQNGYVVYLKCNIERLFERTAKDNRRPLLNTADPKQKLKEIVQMRDPLYRETADCVVDTSRTSTNALIREIIKRVKRYQAQVKS